MANNNRKRRSSKGGPTGYESYGLSKREEIDIEIHNIEVRTGCKMTEEGKRRMYEGPKNGQIYKTKYAGGRPVVKYRWYEPGSRDIEILKALHGENGIVNDGTKRILKEDNYTTEKQKIYGPVLVNNRPYANNRSFEVYVDNEFPKYNNNGSAPRSKKLKNKDRN